MNASCVQVRDRPTVFLITSSWGGNNNNEIGVVGLDNNNELLLGKLPPPNMLKSPMNAEERDEYLELAANMDMEEVIEHCTKRLSIPNGDIAEKMFKCKLVNYPTSLAAFSCGACPEGRRFLDTSSDKKFNRHVKEMCGVRSTEEQNRYKISWCGGCHTRFDTLDELNQHLEYNKVSKTFCLPNNEMLLGKCHLPTC